MTSVSVLSSWLLLLVSPHADYLGLIFDFNINFVVCIFNPYLWSGG